MEKAISSDLIRGHIDTIILYSLIDGDKFAQQISDAIELKSNSEYKMNQATLYSSLKRLETLKYVSSYWYDSGENNGRRKFFKITDLGKNTVKSNLDNWSFSRALIDKLVDCSPEPVYQTQYVEKIVEVPVPIQFQAQPSPTNFNEISKDSEQNQIKNVEVESTIQPNFLQDSSEKITEQASRQEINFRNILNGLIKTSQPKKQENTTELLEPVVKSTEDKSEKLKFNETITTVDYNLHKTQNTGKIDFGDLAIKAAQEGYKIRISSKDSSLSNGKLLINKLNLGCAVAIYLIFLIEFLLVALLAKNILKLSALSIALSLTIATTFPVVIACIYLKKPSKRSNKLVHADIILTAVIIVFNLLLITFACNLIFGVNFYDIFSLLIYLILPAIIYVDVLIFYIIKFFFAKSKLFLIKKGR